MEARRVMHQPIADQVLVIGYGNSLRGDDGIGMHVADLLSRHGWANIHVISTAQLTPELAKEVALARGVIFVDACRATEGSAVRVQEIAPVQGSCSESHLLSPKGLLQLASKCFGHAPRAWLVIVDGYHFRLSNTISAAAETNARAAGRVVIELAQQILASETQHA
jgi:hydrogenase maturation protease